MLKSLGRNDEGDEMINKSKIMLEKIYFWEERGRQLYLPTWHL